jgi:hypothetical protein
VHQLWRTWLIVKREYIITAHDFHPKQHFLTFPNTDFARLNGLKFMFLKTKYMLLSRHRNAGQNHDIKIATNRSFENVAQFRYLRTTITN